MSGISYFTNNLDYINYHIQASVISHNFVPIKESSLFKGIDLYLIISFYSNITFVTENYKKSPDISYKFRTKSNVLR